MSGLATSPSRVVMLSITVRVCYVLLCYVMVERMRLFFYYFYMIIMHLGSCRSNMQVTSFA